MFKLCLESFHDLLCLMFVCARIALRLLCRFLHSCSRPMYALIDVTYFLISRRKENIIHLSATIREPRRTRQRCRRIEAHSRQGNLASLSQTIGRLGLSRFVIESNCYCGSQIVIFEHVHGRCRHPGNLQPTLRAVSLFYDGHHFSGAKASRLHHPA